MKLYIEEKLFKFYFAIKDSLQKRLRGKEDYTSKT